MLTIVNAARRTRFTLAPMLDMPVIPPIVVKDTPKPRRVTSLSEARELVEDLLRAHRTAPFRDVLARLRNAQSEDEAIEAVGALRELLALEDLLAA
jgi:hypothetical protein